MKDSSAPRCTKARSCIFPLLPPPRSTDQPHRGVSRYELVTERGHEMLTVVFRYRPSFTSISGRILPRMPTNVYRGVSVTKHFSPIPNTASLERIGADSVSVPGVAVMSRYRTRAKYVSGVCYVPVYQYQLVLGWKTHELYYETDELPNPRPTQPKKK